MPDDNCLFDRVFKPTQSSEKTFLINERKKISYLEFHFIVNKIANYLVDINLAPGDRVAVQAEKNIIQLALYVATVKAGGIYLPLNTGYTLNELDYFISDAQPKVVVVDENIQKEIKQMPSTLMAQTLTLNLDESGSLIEAVSNYSTYFNAVNRSENDLAAILYLSLIHI